MREAITEWPPLLKARIAGVFYLLNILTIFLAIFFFRGLFVSGNPAATATNILTHESLFRLGFAAELISTACSIGVSALLYVLLEPVNRSLSLLAAFFRLVACAIFALSYLFQLAPLQILGATHYLTESREQLQALAFLLYTFHARTSDIAIVFFAFHFTLLGYLIFSSTFLPRFLGVLLVFAGLSGLIFLAPSLGRFLFPYFAPFGLLGEVSLAVWLLARGVNIQRWKEQASAAAGNVA